MPRGPQGQKRPHSTNAAAVHVMKIATGQIEESVAPPPPEPPRATVVREGPPEDCLDDLPILGSHLVPPDDDP